MKDLDTAQQSYERVIQIEPHYIDARINLSTILQNIGKADQALDTLKDYDLDSCSVLPVIFFKFYFYSKFKDERLLIRQAELLLEQGNKKQYIKCIRMVLISHFYAVNKMMSEVTSARFRTSSKFFIRCKIFNRIILMIEYENILGLT